MLRRRTLNIATRAIQVGKVNIYLSVKAAGAQQGLVRISARLVAGEDDDPELSLIHPSLVSSWLRVVLTLVVGAPCSD